MNFYYSIERNDIQNNASIEQQPIPSCINWKVVGAIILAVTALGLAFAVTYMVGAGHFNQVEFTQLRGGVDEFLLQKCSQIALGLGLPIACMIVSVIFVRYRNWHRKTYRIRAEKKDEKECVRIWKEHHQQVPSCINWKMVGTVALAIFLLSISFAVTYIVGAGHLNHAGLMQLEGRIKDFFAQGWSQVGIEFIIPTVCITFFVVDIFTSYRDWYLETHVTRNNLQLQRFTQKYGWDWIKDKTYDSCIRDAYSVL